MRRSLASSLATGIKRSQKYQEYKAAGDTLAVSYAKIVREAKW